MNTTAHNKKGPIIGISAHFKDQNSMIADAYVQAVVKAGGIPLILPLVNDHCTIEQMIAPLDGLIMSGGGDMEPSLWGEKIIPESGEPNLQRDLFDIQLINGCHKAQIPILGICRGMQAINVAFGGTLYQDIYSQIDQELLVHDQTAPKQEPTHLVNIEPDTLLATLVKKSQLEVNTIHHQAVKDVALGFRASAFATDGICEAIESEYYPILGVQWHPEHLSMADFKEQDALFNYLVQEAIVYHKARAIHQEVLTLDSHCDTPMVWFDGIDLGKWQNDTQVDFEKMRVGGIDATFMVAYLEQKEMNEENSQEAFERANTIINNIKLQLKHNAERATLATEPEQLPMLKQSGKQAIILGIENGYALNGRIEEVKNFYNKGVRYITLCHNGDNDLCDSARGNHMHFGLSDFGKKVIAEMNKLGMMIDIAHAADDTIEQAIALSTKPIVSTHSCCRALCHSARNLTDEQIKALAAKGAVCQICLYQGFLSDHEAATVQTVVDHITHIVNLVGIDYVGIGSDFDGGGGIHGCQGSNELINITKQLIRNGYTKDDIAKILGGNFIRVWKANQNN